MLALKTALGDFYGADEDRVKWILDKFSKRSGKEIEQFYDHQIKMVESHVIESASEVQKKEIHFTEKGRNTESESAM